LHWGNIELLFSPFCKREEIPPYAKRRRYPSVPKGGDTPLCKKEEIPPCAKRRR
jgi:hypothetical protein